MYDYLIVGAGYAGAISARRLAEEANARVLLIDRRPQIAGNMYDSPNEYGIITHWYGPHISVMNERRVFDFLSRFTDWRTYHHRVNAEIDGVEVPLPINFTSIDLLYPVDEAIAIKSSLVNSYGAGSNVAILELRNSDDQRIRQFAEFVFEKVFLHYTMKMWDLRPEEIDPSVTARIPVRLSYDDRHFLHTYQVMPSPGFTSLFERMLDHPNITVRLETPASEVLRLEDDGGVKVDGERFSGGVIYTGALDELFDFKEGDLPYRSLDFEFEAYPKDYVQETPVLNWPDTRPETRRTEMKRLGGQAMEGITTTIVERPGAYSRDSEKFNEPMYPINTEQNQKIYQRYLDRVGKYPQLLPIGRLADYRYYNMEAVIFRTLEAIDELLKR